MDFFVHHELLCRGEVDRVTKSVVIVHLAGQYMQPNGCMSSKITCNPMSMDLMPRRLHIGFVNDQVAPKKTSRFG